MRSKLITTFLAVLTFVSIGGVSLARAQSVDETDIAVIPFDFYAGGQKMPAGKYTIGINLEQHTIEITDYAKKKSVFVLGTPAGDGQSEWQLVFQKVGDNYALDEMKSDLVDIGFHSDLPAGVMVGQISSPQRIEVALNHG
jgi:hypothetical protein